jgi:hypothetical protein
MIRVVAFCLTATVFIFVANSAFAQVDGNQTDQTQDELARYEATVIATLRVVRKEEVKFINDVFDLIRKGKLPQFVLDRSFLWVRKNRLYSPYPFIYFERVLRIYASRVKAELPAFDYEIYNTGGSKTFSGTSFNSRTFQSTTQGSFTQGAITQGSTVEKEKTFGSKTFSPRKKN